MITTAVIAEFNPFHKGHAYLLSEAKRITGADRIIVIMSGNFTQRGDVAICDKFSRAGSALLCGADLIIELPFAYATAPAENFALGAVSILNKINKGTNIIINYLVFGSECGDISTLTECAEVLRNESDEFKNILNEELKKGASYPLARERAFAKCCPKALSLSPNNILGIEYINALSRLKSSIKPVTIKRLGMDYNSEDLEDGLVLDINPGQTAPDTVNDKNNFISATAFRKAIKDAKNSAEIFKFISENSSPEVAEIMSECISKSFPIFNDDASEYFAYALLSNRDFLNDFADFNEAFSNRISNLLDSSNFIASDINTLIGNIKTKNITEARIKRALIHLLAGYTKVSEKQAIDAAKYSEIGYIRVLGLNSKGGNLIKDIKKAEAPVEIITKLADTKIDLKNAGDINSLLLSFDIHSANIFSLIVSSKFKKTCDNEYRRSPVIIK